MILKVSIKKVKENKIYRRSTKAEKLYNNRDNVIKAFENRVFSFKDGFQKKESCLIKHYQIG